MVSVYFSFFVIHSLLIFKKCCVGIEAEDDSAKAKVAEVIEEENPEIGYEGEKNEGVQDQGEKDEMGTEDTGAEGNKRESLVVRKANLKKVSPKRQLLLCQASCLSGGASCLSHFLALMRTERA
jgi:hypothetical protein